jgi:hypothetical protein
VLPHSVRADFGVSVHVAVPLHDRVMQSVVVQLMPVPEHVPPPQTSPWVHRSPSSQAVLVRHCQTPPSCVQCQVWPPQLTPWHRLWVVPSQVNVPPPPQVPVAPAGPHPVQNDATVITFAPQLSPPPQVPAVVEHPVAGVHAAWQQPPAVHVELDGVHTQSSHSPSPSQVRVHCVG